MEKIKLNSSQIEELCEKSSGKITLEEIKDFFVFRDKNNTQKIPHRGTFILNSELNKKYFNFNLDGKEEIETTAGRIIFNSVVLKGKIRELVPYQNIQLSDDSLSSLKSKTASLLLNDKISGKEYGEYIDRLFWIAFSITPLFGVSLDLGTIKPIPEVIKLRDDYVKNNHKVIESKDVNTYSDFEKLALKISEEKLSKERNASGLDIYKSGASGKFGNNYKNSSFARGSLVKSDDLRVISTISTSNLVEGIKKNEIKYYADSLIIGAFSRAVSTQDGKNKYIL
jgi:hypothetical protein